MVDECFAIHRVDLEEGENIRNTGNDVAILELISRNSKCLLEDLESDQSALFYPACNRRLVDTEKLRGCSSREIDIIKRNMKVLNRRQSFRADAAASVARS